MRSLLVASLAANVLFVLVLGVSIVRDRRDNHDRRIDLDKAIAVDGALRISPSLLYPRTVTVYSQPRASVEPPPKPPIAGRDIRTGKHVALAAFGGKPVFVSVWGSWNVGSLAQAARIGRFARAHAAEVAYLGIDSEDSRREGRAFATRFGMDFPSISDPTGKLGAWASTPTTLVFDRRHRLVRRLPGEVSLEQLNRALRRVARRP